MKLISDIEAWKGKSDCKKCNLRSTVLFAGLEQKEFEKIHHTIDDMLIKSGGTLYRTGDKARHLFTIRSGVIKLVQYLPDGSQRIVRLIRSTDVTGLEALLDQEYQHDAIALQDTEICRLPAKIVSEMSLDNPALHRELLSRWQKALMEADAWLTELSTGSAKKRVARMLLRLVGDRSTCPCSLFSREDMGAMLGITTETASRTIAEFKRQKLLFEDKNHMLNVNLNELGAIADS